MGFRFRGDSKVAFRLDAESHGLPMDRTRREQPSASPEARSAIRSERRYDKAAQKQAACSTPSSTSGFWWPLSRYSHELCADESLGASQRINTQYQAESLIP